MAGRKKKLPWTRAQLEKLHECWKASRNRSQCLELVAKKLPEIPPPVAWSLVRRLSRTERDWQMTAKQKERDREERKLAKERLKQEKLRRRDERQRAKEWRGQRESLRETLRDDMAEQVAEAVGTDFFFCPDVRQHVCRLSCVFRVFSKDTSHGGSCEKCERMDAHIPALERIIGRSDNEGEES